jgi:hypothetical protein
MVSRLSGVYDSVKKYSGEREKEIARLVRISVPTP